jgi:NAD(P)H dehydrogenase (quinone)
MNCLLVVVHPEPASFSAALKDVAVHELELEGHTPVVSDLYRIGWNAVLGAVDFPAVRARTDYLDLSLEQEHAFAIRGQSADVAAEQAKVLAADLVLFHFPLWWFSMPAILKGWVDRVSSRGFAYSAGRKYESGHFTAKRAMSCLTTGTASTLYEPKGIDGDLHHVLWPIHNGILAYTGLTLLPPFAAWMPARVSAEGRQSYVDAYAQRLRTLDRMEPLFFHPWGDYDESQRLKPGIAARSGVPWNPSAAQTFEASASDFAQCRALLAPPAQI